MSEYVSILCAFSLSLLFIKSTYQFEKGKATRSNILSQRIHGLYSLCGRKESDTTEWLSLHFTKWKYLLCLRNLSLCSFFYPTTTFKTLLFTPCLLFHLVIDCSLQDSLFPLVFKYLGVQYLLVPSSSWCAYCCCSVTTLCLILLNLMDCSMPGFPVPHHTPEFLKLMSIALVMPSNYLNLILCHSLLLLPSKSFPASESFPMIQLFASGSQCTGASASASVLPMSIPGWFPLGLTGLISLLFKGFSSVFSSTTVQKYQFFGALPSLWSSSHNHTWLLERPYPWLYGLLAKQCLCFLTHCLGLS